MQRLQTRKVALISELELSSSLELCVARRCFSKAFFFVLRETTRTNRSVCSRNACISIPSTKNAMINSCCRLVRKNWKHSQANWQVKNTHRCRIPTVTAKHWASPSQIFVHSCVQDVSFAAVPFPLASTIDSFFDIAFWYFSVFNVGEVGSGRKNSSRAHAPLIVNGVLLDTSSISKI